MHRLPRVPFGVADAAMKRARKPGIPPGGPAQGPRPTNAVDAQGGRGMERFNGDRTTDTAAPTSTGRDAEGREGRGVTGLSPEERARPGVLSPPTYEPPKRAHADPSRKVGPWLWTGLMLTGIFLVAALAFFAIVPLIVALPIVIVLFLAWAIIKGLASRSYARPVTEAGKAAEPPDRLVGPR